MRSLYVETETKCPVQTVLPAKLTARYSRASLGNLEIDLFTEHEFTTEVLEHAMTGRTARQIATVNAQFFVLAEKMLPFRSCLKNADYLCADGMPIVWACKLFGGLEVPRIAGVDLITDLCSVGAPRGMRIFLLGGYPGTAEATASMLTERYPGLEIAGVLCPPFRFEQDAAQLEAALETIEAAKPNVLFVALGAPRQEIFIDRHVRALGVPIAVGIGGSFEILSGQAPRAPQWMRAKGLEWFYRFVHDPGRLWKRYLIGNAEFLWCVAKWRYRSAVRHRVSAREVEVG
jgi:N-acetylglucosaminyldiphosphoundecaprenol N-acetyl-beta-D-mannosaminyltransferase